jgi:hypothetical protein
MSDSVKTLLSWVVAIFLAVVALHFIFWLIGAAFEVLLNLIMLIPLMILAIPIFLIVRKKLFR